MYEIVFWWVMATLGIFVVGVYGLRISWELIKTGVVILFAVGVIMLVGCTAEEVYRDGGIVRNDTHITVRDRGVQVTYPASVKRERLSLPQKCKPYYNDGTERWIDCMGVGYVREMNRDD